MNNDSLVSASRLDELIQTGKCEAVDCRYDFSGRNKGRADWLAGHIPGASYAHLDDDLAAPVEENSGRHPLPKTEDFARYLASIGWSSGMLLVAYDAGSNAISARLWWLMRYFGQPAALLNGGLAAWLEAGFKLESGRVEPDPGPVEDLVPDESMIVSTADILDSLRSRTLDVLDARAPERFSGAEENLDTKAGHIPGSLNRHFGSNLDSADLFLDPGSLAEQFKRELGHEDASRVVHSCGSGVTACHNLFAMELAGMGATRLYPGSWSQWIRNPAHPVETGSQV